MSSASWSYRLRLAWERRKLATSETWLRLWGIDGEIVVRTGRIHHGNLCVCPERGDGEWCDKCEGYAMEQGRALRHPRVASVSSTSSRAVDSRASAILEQARRVLGEEPKS